MQTVAFCELDPFCRRVLAKHWPGVPIYDDVTTLTGDAVRRDVGHVDVICGGFPCQGISSAGLRAGLSDPRSALWGDQARLICELRPSFVIVENSADLLCRGLGDILGEMAKIGYDAEWHCIPALAVGADHIRDRIWIVAYPDSARCQPSVERRWKQRSQEMGKNVAKIDADNLCTRPQGRLSSGEVGEDARAISARLGSALGSQTSFPKLYGAGSPVLGGGEDGIPNRVDRMHAIGNAVVPQIPEIIGRAIMQVQKEA